MCPKNCNEHGLCTDGTCWCDWGWYSDSCTTVGISDWGLNSWRSFQAIFIILYSILFAVSVKALGIQLGNDKVREWKRFFHRLFRSSKNLCLFFLTGIGILRLFWLSIDPLGFKGYLDYRAERLLFETVYALIYELYCSALLVWAGLYQGMRVTNYHPFKILRRIIISLMVIALPASIAMSVVKSYRLPYEYLGALYLAFMITGVSVLIVGFVVFGILLAVYIEEHTSLPERRLMEAIPINEMENSRGSRKDRSLSIRNRPSNAFSLAAETDRAENSWEMLHEHEGEKKRYSHVSKFSEVAITPVKIPKKQSKCISVITKDDRNAFRKVTVLLTVSVVLGIVSVFSIIFFTYHVGTLTPQQQLVILYTVFFIENFACYLIYIVFMTEIKVKDKNYLLFFSELHKKMKKAEPQIGYPDWLKNISYRLHGFYV